MGQATRHDVHTYPLFIQTRSAPYRIAETVTRHLRSTARLERTPLSYDSYAPVQLDEATASFRAVFWVLPRSIFSACLHTYGPNHSLIGLFRGGKWAEPPCRCRPP